MAAKLCDRAVRTSLGIPREAAARLAGVGKNTLVLYEIDPIGVVGTDTREACAVFYDDLRALLERCDERASARRQRGRRQ